MSYSVRARDAYSTVVTALTGMAGAGALTACGLLAGVAAREHAHAQQARQDREAARQAAQQAAYLRWQQQRAAWLRAQKPKVVTVWRRHHTRTVVDTRVVQAAASTVGPGSAVTRSAPASAPAAAPQPTRRVTHVSHAAPPPPPPPPPAPAPTSGS